MTRDSGLLFWGHPADRSQIISEYKLHSDPAMHVVTVVSFVF